MARRIYKEVRRQPSDQSQGGVYDEPGIMQPGGDDQGLEAGRGAQKTIGNIDDALRANEEAVQGGGGAAGKSKLSAGELAGQESATGPSSPWMTSIQAAAGPDFKNAKLKNWSRRKKMISGGVIGVIAISVFGMFTLTTTFRIPIEMNGLMDKVGREAKEVVEERAARLVFAYLFGRVNGNGDRFIFNGSLIGSLFTTWQTNKFEDKLFKETGLKIVRERDGRVHLIHDGRDKGEVRNYEDVMKLAEKDQLLRRDVAKVVRLVTPAWKVHVGSKVKGVKKRYHVRYRTRDYDSSKTREQNIEDLRTDKIEVVEAETTQNFQRGAVCALTSEDCEFLDPENREGATGRGPPADERALESAEQVGSDIQEAADDAKIEAAKTGRSYTEILNQKLFAKLSSSALAKSGAAFIPAFGQIDMLAFLQHAARTAAANKLTTRLPAYMASAATGAMFLDWQGNNSQIMAGLMDLNFVNALSDQMAGAEKAATHNYTYSGEAKGVEPDVKINNNFIDPREELMDGFLNRGPGTLILLPLEIWYHTIGKFMAVLGNIGSAVFEFLFGDLIDSVLKSVFGENWQEELTKFAAKLIMGFFAINVDPLAIGPKLFNLLYAGGDALMNDFTRFNLGGRALTGMKESGLFEARPSYVPNNYYDRKLDMAVLPIKDRLFSFTQANSLASQAVRAMPSSFTPINVANSGFQQLAALPGTFLSIFSGKAGAAAITTAEQDANVVNVRQWGWTASDYNREIAEEVRHQADPICPDVDQEKEVNVCQGDTEVASGLMCEAATILKQKNPQRGSELLVKYCPEFLDLAQGTDSRVSGVGDVKELAARLLAKEVPKGADRPGISFVFPFAKQDLSAMADNSDRNIEDCGLSIKLDVALLQILDKLSDKYNVGLGFFVTNHGCDGGQHPRGKAVDIDGVNGHILNNDPDGDMHGIDAALAREFMEEVGELMPANRGGLGQSQCSPLRTAVYPSWVETFPDACHHFHVDTRGQELNNRGK